MTLGEGLGLLGFVTGLIGTVTGGLALRRTGQFKALDLRLQLRREVNEFEATLAAVKPVMDQARQSRVRILAAEGLGRSGAEKVFDKDWEEDVMRSNLIAADFTLLSVNFSQSNAESLERCLGDLHRLSLQATQLRDKYIATQATDDVRRGQLRMERTTMAAAERAKPPPPKKSKLGE